MAFDATLEKVMGVRPHPNADRLDLVMVGGFQAVVAKDQFKLFDHVWYIHPDAVLPIEEEWALPYLKYAQKRVRAIQIRGEWSEGIVIPLNEIKTVKMANFVPSMDVSEQLKVTHYEIPEPENDDALYSQLPFNIKETYQDRFESLHQIPYGELCDIALKVDGKSNSFYLKNNHFGVLGRCQEMKPDYPSDYTVNIDKLQIKEKLQKYSTENNIDVCFRGEVYGVGISTSGINPHSKVDKNWCMFGLWLINERKYAYKGSEHYFINVAEKLDIPSVEIIERDVILTPELIKKYSQDLTEINGKPFEGVVINHSNGSFKVINKYYDSKK